MHPLKLSYNYLFILFVYYYIFDGKCTTVSQQGNWGGFFAQLLAPNNHSVKARSGRLLFLLLQDYIYTFNSNHIAKLRDHQVVF